MHNKNLKFYRLLSASAGSPVNASHVLPNNGNGATNVTRNLNGWCGAKMKHVYSITAFAVVVILIAVLAGCGTAQAPDSQIYAVNGNFKTLVVGTSTITGAISGGVGPVGPAGPAGNVGPTGPAGSVGPTGPAGSIGPTGSVGPMGAPGLPVYQSLSGSGISEYGTTLIDIPNTGFTCAANSTYEYWAVFWGHQSSSTQWCLELIAPTGTDADGDILRTGSAQGYAFTKIGVTVNAGVGTTPTYIVFHLFIITGAIAGTIKWQLASINTTTTAYCTSSAINYYKFPV
jgi:hypothetical protein